MEAPPLGSFCIVTAEDSFHERQTSEACAFRVEMTLCRVVYRVEWSSKGECPGRFRTVLWAFGAT